MGPTAITTLANVTGMSLLVAANRYYQFEFTVLWRSDNTNNGITLAVTGPAGGTLTYDAIIGNRTGAAANATGAFIGAADSSGTGITQTAVATINRTNVARIVGVLVNGANAGTVQLQYAAESGSNNTMIKQGSAGFLRLVP